MQSKAKTPKEYLAELAPEVRREIEAVRTVIRANLPKGMKETMGYGMIAYVVPLTRYSQGYLDQKDVPLPYAGLAAQKKHNSLYISNVYMGMAEEGTFRKAWAATGKKLDMGKSCIRFKRAEDLALALIGQTISHTSIDAFIKTYEASRLATKRKKK